VLGEQHLLHPLVYRTLELTRTVAGGRSREAAATRAGRKRRRIPAEGVHLAHQEGRSYSPANPVLVQLRSPAGKKAEGSLHEVARQVDIHTQMKDSHGVGLKGS